MSSYIKYNNKKPDTLTIRLLKGWAYYFAGVFINMWFVTVMTALSMKALIIKLVVGVAALVIVNGMFFNYAYNAAKSDIEQINYHGMKEDKLMSLKMASFATIFGLIMYILLVLAKVGVFDGTKLGEYGFNYYMLANLYTVPWVGLFTEGRTMESLNTWGLLGLLLLFLTEPATIIASYEMTKRNIDFTDKLVYGKKGKKGKA